MKSSLPYVLLVACLPLLAACGPKEARILGQFSGGETISIAAAKEISPGQNVTVHGMLFEKCPVAGCWFRMEDGQARIKVDTKSADFVVLEVPIPIAVTVSGKLRVEGDEPVIEATGIRY